MPDNILVVDDEIEIADLIEVYLKNENYAVFKFYTAQEALQCMEAAPIDLTILDIMLPDMDGFTLCKKIRERHTYPIIMLTAKDAETDKITGLTLGADDYMTKPFRPLELVARVKSQLRRYQKYNPAHSEASGTSSGLSGDPLICGSLTMNIKAHTCFLGEKPLALTPTEFSILRILLENSGNVVSSDRLFHQIWQDEYYSKSNNTITVHIRHLREKLGDRMDKPRFIKTIWGVGYKIESWSKRRILCLSIQTHPTRVYQCHYLHRGGGRAVSFHLETTGWRLGGVAAGSHVQNKTRRSVLLLQRLLSGKQRNLLRRGCFFDIYSIDGANFSVGCRLFQRDQSGDRVLVDRR